MKRILFFATAYTLFFTGCMKHDNKQNCNFDACAYPAPANEILAVQDYLSSQGITATQHCSGVFYEITAPGNTRHPSICSSVSVNYKGTLTDGSVFQESSIQYGLGGLIPGWQNTLPMIGEGGHITLYIPPSLGYGDMGQPGIPANSILIFEIELVQVQ